jgi:peptidoglycan/xylan/chitin deacetylase (PgdA/CDA1 family)
LTVAWQLLQQADLRATIFLVRDWVVAGVNGEGEFMRPVDVAQLSAEGMEFGAHTSTHPKLDRTPRPQIVTELKESRAAVEGWTRRPCRFFAYPYGNYGRDALEVAAEQFDAAVTVECRWWARGEPGNRIPRIGIHQDMTATRSMLMSRLAAFVDGEAP